MLTKNTKIGFYLSSSVLLSLLVLSSLLTSSLASITTVPSRIASRVYGQESRFDTGGSNFENVSNKSLSYPTRTIQDNNGGLYVADTYNNRVLYYSAGMTDANRVYGQPDFSSNYSPYYDDNVNERKLNRPAGLALDNNGGLYIADTWNNRVLYFSSGMTIPSRVYGQPNFFTRHPNNNGELNAQSLFLPQALAVDSIGGLYVADETNTRVLYYPPESTYASRVYGQPNFNSSIYNNGGISANSLCYPQGLSLDSSDGLYIADTCNDRVLYYPPNTTTATKVYGRSTFNGSGGSAFARPVGVKADNMGGVYIADTSNSRVLYYSAGMTTPNRIYGQPEFTLFPNPNTSASSMYRPSDIEIDRFNNGIYIVDSGNNRILHYSSYMTVANKVYGQPDFNVNYPNGVHITSGSLSKPHGLYVANDNGIYVADTANNRVLYYAQGVTVASKVYGQRTYNTAYYGNVSAESLHTPTDVKVDANGGIYIADRDNNRVLYYSAGMTIASRVYGQPNFSSNTREISPTNTNLEYPSSIAIDNMGGLYVADSGNYRVLYFSPGMTTATRVYGQPDFTSGRYNNGGVSASSLSYANSLVLDNNNGLYVSDSENSRILYYSPGMTVASQVYGQPNFTSRFWQERRADGGLHNPGQLTLDNNNGLYAVDATYAGRVLYFSSGMTIASRVYGQASFNYQYSPPEITARRLRLAFGVAVDTNDNLYIGDIENNRVLFFPTRQTCEPVVNNLTDDGTASQCGTLSYAIDEANTTSNKTISFPTNLNSVTLTGGSLPNVAKGTIIQGRCDANGTPSVTINGNGTTPPLAGLVLNGGVTMQGINIKGFLGKPQLLARSTSYRVGKNVLSCVKAGGN